MPEKRCEKQLERNRELLREKRRDEEKHHVVTGVMVFISVVMVLLFLHGITTQDLSSGPGIFFVLRCMGYFVVLALPLLIWNVCRLARYTSKRKRGADYYVYEENNEESDYEEMDSAEDRDVMDRVVSSGGKNSILDDESSGKEGTQDKNSADGDRRLEELLISQGMVEIPTKISLRQ